MNTALLTVNNLTIKDSRSNQALVKDLSFHLTSGKSLGIVGESGSGKSLTCRAIMGLLARNLKAEGEVYYDGANLLTVNNAQLRAVRGRRIGMILQNPMASFNALYRIRSHFTETLQTDPAIKPQDYDRLMKKYLDLVQVSYDQAIDKFPHELSGGMLQRIAIAITLSLQPEVLIADEPTTAIDSINAYKIIKELQHIQAEIGLSMIVISHDLGVVRHLVDDIVIMKQGTKVEENTTDNIFENPINPYTQQLVGINRQLAQGMKEAIR